MSMSLDLQKQNAFNSAGWVHGKFFIQLRCRLSDNAQQQQSSQHSSNINSNSSSNNNNSGSPSTPRTQQAMALQYAEQQAALQKQKQAAPPNSNAVSHTSAEKILYLDNTANAQLTLQNFTGHADQQWLFENGNYIRNVRTYVFFAQSFALFFCLILNLNFIFLFLKYVIY